LSRLPPAEDPAAPPVAIGYTPYKLVQLNTAEQPGRIVIYHQPKNVPIWQQKYQLVVGAAAAAQYSITVTGRLAEDAAICVERNLSHAKLLQLELPKLTAELDDLWLSMRLFERKLVVAEVSPRGRGGPS
jgi:hypothetical protein